MIFFCPYVPPQQVDAACVPVTSTVVIKGNTINGEKFVLVEFAIGSKIFAKVVPIFSNGGE